MRSILITGCNRGLGLGIVKNLVKRADRPQYLVATCRDAQKAEDLKQIAEQNKGVHILELDLRNVDSYGQFSEKVGEIVKDVGLNVLFNNAGVSPKFTRLGLVKLEQLMDTYTTNAVAPIMLAKTLLPLLKKAADLNPKEPMGIGRSAVVNMSSLLGSIALNSDGGLYPYRCSKAALNMATKTMSIDLKKDGILVTCLHPGWVKTNLGGKNAPLDVETSTSAIVELLYKLEEKHNGTFYSWDGNPLDW